MTKFADNLRKLMDNSHMAILDVAKAIGVSRQTIGFWLKGDYFPKRSHIEALSKVFSISTRELMFGDDIDVASFSSETNTPPAGYVCVPEYRMRASAGDGYINDFEEIMESTPCFYKETFFTSRGIKPNTCKRIKVDGDSMEPFMFNGDTVMFVNDHLLNANEIKDGNIYVLSINGALKIKRLATTKNGLIVISENKSRYPDEIYTNDELDNLVVFGKVIEISRTC